MHKSRLAGFMIDCQDGIDSQKGQLGAAADFWGAALGMRINSAGDEQPDKYVKLENSRGLAIEVQRVAHPSRVHLDIETASRRKCSGWKRWARYALKPCAPGSSCRHPPVIDFV